MTTTQLFQGFEPVNPFEYAHDRDTVISLRSNNMHTRKSFTELVN